MEALDGVSQGAKVPRAGAAEVVSGGNPEAPEDGVQWKLVSRARFAPQTGLVLQTALVSHVHTDQYVKLTLRLAGRVRASRARAEAPTAGPGPPDTAVEQARAAGVESAQGVVDRPCAGPAMSRRSLADAH